MSSCGTHHASEDPGATRTAVLFTGTVIALDAGLVAQVFERSCDVPQRARHLPALIAAIATLEPAVVGGGHGRPLAGPGTAAAVRAFEAQTAGARSR